MPDILFPLDGDQVGTKCEASLTRRLPTAHSNAAFSFTGSFAPRIVCNLFAASYNTNNVICERAASIFLGVLC